MEVTAVELRKFLQFVLVENFHHAAVEFEHAVEAKLTKDAVGMNAGDAHRLADLLLCQRHIERVPGHASDHAKSFAQFDDDVRQAAVSGTLADIDDPLPEHRRI